MVDLHKDKKEIRRLLKVISDVVIATPRFAWQAKRDAILVEASEQETDYLREFSSWFNLQEASHD